MSSSLALRLAGVRKRFGATEALRGIDMEVPRGSLFGLIGPNGAGKTTALSTACGFVYPDAGEVVILGGPPDAMRTKGRMTALPQDAALGTEMPVQSHLTHLARLQGMSRDQALSESARVLAVVGLADAARRRAKTLSHGMLKAVGVAQAFLGKPELVLLDEPTAGLDPRRAFELREAIGKMRGSCAVVISSHNLHELEALCDRAALIDHGRVVAQAAMSELLRKDEEIQVVLATGPEPIEALREQLDATEVQYEPDARRIHVRFLPRPGYEAEDVIGQTLRILLDRGARVSEVKKGQSLERRYLEMT